MQKYAKSIVAWLYAIAVIAVPLVSGDHHASPADGIAIGIAVCSAALVYLVPLAPQIKWGKTAIGAVLAALQVAATQIVGGINGSDWLIIAFAVLSFLGIAVAPATSDNGVSVGVGADK